MTHGHTKSEVGTERICLLNEKGDKYVKEKLTVYNPLEKTFTVLVSTTEGVPTVAGETFATYKVESIDENSCLLKVTQTYKTNPAIVGIFAKRKFKKSTEEHLVFIEHYASTREAVTKENHKKIKKQYH